VVQNGGYSGTLRAMSESIPTNKIKRQEPLAGEAEQGANAAVAQNAATPSGKSSEQAEIGGPAGPEPTRYGDWERKGRCIDF